MYLFSHRRTILPIALVLVSTLACSTGDEADVVVPLETATAGASPEDIGGEAPLAEPGEAASAASPGERVAAGTGALDARLATEIALRFVTDRLVDARHFAITVSAPNVELAPTPEASEEEIARAAELAQVVEGVAEVTVNGEAAPHVERARERQAAERLAAVSPNHAGTEPDVEALVALGTPRNAPPEQAPAPTQDATADAPAAEPEEAAPAAGEVSMREYVIRSGESLSIIAARELNSGDRWMELYEINRSRIGPNPDGVRSGMRIMIPTE